MRFRYQSMIPGIAVLAMLQAAAVAETPVTKKAETIADSQTARLHLRFVKPSQCLLILIHPTVRRENGVMTLLPPGISHVDTDDTAGVMTVTGSKAGVANLTQLINFVDVAKRRIGLNVRFMRCALDPDRTSPIVIGYGKAVVSNNDTAEVTTIADDHLLKAQLSAHINGDDSVMIKATVTAQAVLQEGNGTTRFVEASTLSTTEKTIEGRAIRLPHPRPRQLTRGLGSGEASSHDSLLPPEGATEFPLMLSMSRR